MGTPAAMIRPLGEGMYEVQCVNYDGYPSNMLPMLNTYYITPSEIDELFLHGDASALEPLPEQMSFYHRDKNEAWEDVAPYMDTLEEVFRYLGDGVDFYYIFTEDEEWSQTWPKKRIESQE